MPNPLTYSVQDDTANGKVDLVVLREEVNALPGLGLTVTRIKADGDALSIEMSALADSSQETAIDGAVAVHQGVPLDEELAQREGVDRDPTGSDDDSKGFAVGSRWFNKDDQEEFVCVDPSAGAAVWKRTTVLGTAPSTSADARFSDVELSSPIQTTATATVALTLSETGLAAGRYMLRWYYEWSHDSTSNDFLASVDIDGAVVVAEHQQEPQDAGGGGFGGTNQKFPAQGFAFFNLTAGDHDFHLNYGTSDNGDESTLHRARMVLYKVG